MKKIYIGLFTLIFIFNSCSGYLDVVPEGTATIEMAFNMRTQAMKYLFTCYSYMPKHGNPSDDPGILGGDDLCSFINNGRMSSNDGMLLSRGTQNATNPLFNKWGHYYKALRDCNIFLENIHTVPDMPTWEKEQWEAEVIVLKAYYHFCLVQMYGPVPLIRENLPMDVDVNTVKVVRNPVDECFDYMEELLDEAINSQSLPLKVVDPATELGRITLPIAHTIKAKVMVTAASPLYNGNTDQATLKNKDGTALFNTTYSLEKWEKAMMACREAIGICDRAGIQLYKYPNELGTSSETVATQLSLRLAFTERWNSEIIWGNTQSVIGGGNTGLQQISTAKLNPAWIDAPEIRSLINPTLKMTELFYSENGVPITEDKNWNYNRRFDLRVATTDEKLLLKPGETTVRLNFEREPRYYAYMGFDTGIWYGQGMENETGELWHVAAKKGQTDSQFTLGGAPITGLWAKKYVYYKNVLSSVSSYSVTTYPWPTLRLSDLYLLYAEAINEFEGPNGANSSELFKYIDLVRERAGLEGVKESWDKYAGTNKYNTQSGMQKIIQQERLIELAFEGSRFWDIRRWKIAPELYQTPVQGWDMSQSQAGYFYRPVVIYNQSFGIKDYFWPISNGDLLKNNNLVQNIGWQ